MRIVAQSSGLMTTNNSSVGATAGTTMLLLLDFCRVSRRSMHRKGPSSAPNRTHASCASANVRHALGCRRGRAHGKDLGPAAMRASGCARARRAPV
eukprot:1402498-Pleurochrysis_carterae.AAC.2